MPALYVALAGACMCAALLYLLYERHRAARVLARCGQDGAQALQQATDQIALLRRQLESRTRRIAELEALVVQLAGRLEHHDIDAGDRRLLADIYHEYGTEGHAYYFGRADAPGSAGSN